MKPISISKKQLGKYAVAPYNFVSLPERAEVRYQNFMDLPKHNSYKDKNGKKLLNGYIKYKIKAEMPIIVSSGTEGVNKEASFFKNCEGKYAIPGNTIRGMIRGIAQILSYSSVVGNKNEKGNYIDSDIEDVTFLYRDVASGSSLNKKYITVLGIHPLKRIAQNLKAGYMINERGKFCIIPAEELIEGRTYFRIDEIELRKMIKDKKVTGINFMYNEGLDNEGERIKELNKKIAESRKNRKIPQVRDLEWEKNEILKEFDNSKYYKPYQAKISFEYDKKSGKVVQIDVSGKYKNEGYILSGGFIKGKLGHYIVPKEMDGVNSIDISLKQKEEYLDDLVLTKKADKAPNGVKIKADKRFYELPSAGSKKPVFYIYVNNELHFGFTPYLRLFYTKSVLDGVGTGYKDIDGISYVDSMFGFSNKEARGIEEKISFKSRVSVEDALVIGEGEIDKESSIKMLLAEPKPTSYNLYLMQKSEDKKELAFYDGDFRIRGIKQYWLKDYIEEPEIENDRMSFSINPLKEGTCFEGKINFDNLYEDELGLLLWSLKLNDNCYQNIGLAKPYGFGRVKIHGIELQIEDIDKKYKSFSFDYMYKDDVNKYIEKYKDYFSKEKLNGKSLEEEKPIKELMYIKSRIVKAEEANDFRYMKINRIYEVNRRQRKENEYADKKILPDISYYMKSFESSYNKAATQKSNHVESKGKKHSVEKNQNTQNSKDKRNNSRRLTHNPFSILKDMKIKE